MDTFKIDKASAFLVARLTENAPVRTNPLGATKLSPYPGNLRQNGIVITKISDNRHAVVIGNDAVPYAVDTEYRSKKKMWMHNSIADTVAMIIVT